MAICGSILAGTGMPDCIILGDSQWYRGCSSHFEVEIFKNKEKGHANHSKVEKVAGSMAEAIIVVYMRKSNRPNRIRGNWSIKQCFHKHDTCERPQFAVKSSCDQKVITVVVMWTNERIWRARL